MFLLWQQKSQAYFYPSGSVCLWHQTAKTIDIRKDNTGISDNTFTSPSGERLEIKVRKVLSHHTVTVWNICSSHIILTQVFFLTLLSSISAEDVNSTVMLFRAACPFKILCKHSMHIDTVNILYIYICVIFIYLYWTRLSANCGSTVSHARTHTHAYAHTFCPADKIRHNDNCTALTFPIYIYIFFYLFF